jgi:hypothetical protein
MDGISWWSEDILRQTTSGSRQNSLNSNSLSLEQEQQHLGRHFLIEYHGEGTYRVVRQWPETRRPRDPETPKDPDPDGRFPVGLRLYAHMIIDGPYSIMFFTISF